MANKKKSERIGTINGLEILKQTRPPQDIPFRTGSFKDKRKKREKVNKNHLDKWLQKCYTLTIEGGSRDEKKNGLASNGAC